MTTGYLCDYAAISWQDGAPYSPTYGDIYWHRDGALAEKQQVFIRPLQALADSLPPKSQLTVCELGFGFGINCLLAADVWQDLPADRQLNFISIEKHPVAPAVLHQLLDQYPFSATDALLHHYPTPFVGQHVIWLAKNIRLILLLDDVESALAGLDARVDLWFLDGFAPARNDAMWQQILFRQMFARSRHGARVATYSAAGHVRRSLEASGFVTEKIAGFSHKKEMLQATRPGTWQPAAHDCGSTLVIGGGIAGHYCAEALSRRGADITMIDCGGPAASKIPQLTVKPQLAVQPELRYRFSLLACRYMQDSAGFHPAPIRWRGQTEEECERLRKIAALFPDDIIEGDDQEIILHQAGWLSYHDLVRETKYNRLSGLITTLERQPDSWIVMTDTGLRYEADNVVLATGSNRSLLDQALQVRAIRGQAVSVNTRRQQEILTAEVTVFPTVQGRSVVSGTYARANNIDVDPAETETLLAGARQMLELNETDIKTHVGIRAVSRDRLPVIGAIPDPEALKAANKVTDIRTFVPGLYYCTAFGSRGATHARLCAEQVVSGMLYEPAALELKQQAMLSPARFHLRDRHG